jgi:ubiquitin-protein ligase E3 D
MSSENGRRREIRNYSLATHLTAEMLEIGQAHACHRFVVEDAEQEKARLLVSWLD